MKCLLHIFAAGSPLRVRVVLFDSVSLVRAVFPCDGSNCSLITNRLSSGIMEISWYQSVWQETRVICYNMKKEYLKSKRKKQSQAGFEVLYSKLYSRGYPREPGSLMLTRDTWKYTQHYLRIARPTHVTSIFPASGVPGTIQTVEYSAGAGARPGSAAVFRL